MTLIEMVRDEIRDILKFADRTRVGNDTGTDRIVLPPARLQTLLDLIEKHADAADAGSDPTPGV